LILGLDISTSSTGICIVDGDKLVYCSYFSPKGDDLFSKIDGITDHLDHLCDMFDITSIYIEEPLISMSQKYQTSADVLKLLIRFNFAISYHLYKKLKIKPTYVPFSSARRILSLKSIEIKEEKIEKLQESVHKDKILGCQYVINKFPVFKDMLFIEKNMYSRGKNVGLPKNCVFDCSDAVVIALAGESYVREIGNT
jgi:hypothetical protein